MATACWGVIIRNRGFFPAELARDARIDILVIIQAIRGNSSGP